MTRWSGAHRRFDATLGLQVLALAAAYFGAAKFGLSLALETKQVTAVWPPTGVAFAALLVLGYRAWPGVFLGAFLANITANEGPQTAVGIALGNTLAGLLGVWLSRRWGRIDARLGRVRDVVALVLGGGVLACTLSASAGVLVLVVSRIVPFSAYWSVWRVWWLGDAMGVLLFAPFVLSWWRGSGQVLSHARRAELFGLLLLLASICQLTFAAPAEGRAFRLEYAVFPCVIWVALRFSQREAASVSLIISGFALWGAVQGRGPFAAGPLDQRLMLLDAFMAVVTTTALTLNAVVAERRRAEAALASARDELEQRVQQRTAELARTNQELGKKNEEVEAFVYIVSHDLRAPLVNLQGFANELSQSCRELDEQLGRVELAPAVAQPIRRILDDDVPGALRYISAATSKFQRLIEALLALSRYGRQAYRSDDLDVRALVQGTLDTLRQSIDRAKAEVRLKELPHAQGDATAVGQVFANLLVNALAYLDPARAGAIEIGGEKRGDMVEYWVKDNGTGIPASAQPRLFQVFQRFHPQRAQGEGMGLAIVKRVVERHGGRVWAESQEGTGTTMRLTLPATGSVASP